MLEEEKTKVGGSYPLDIVVKANDLSFVRATLLFGSQRAMSVGLRYPIPVGHCQ